MRRRIGQIQWLRYLIFVCGFLLFWEWLRPLDQISDTGNLPIFIMFTAICFLLSMFKLRWWLSFLLKFILMVIVLQAFLIQENLVSGSWFTFILTELQSNLQFLFTGDFVSLSPFFRTLLFLILLWLMSYLLYYWFIVVNRIFFFIIMTFLYIGILDTFTPYDGSAAIVRVFLISFFAMGISAFARLYQDGEKRQLPKHVLLWSIPLLSILAVSAAVGYAAPKLPPQWADPVPFIQTMSDNNNENDGEGGIQKVGYGENDSRLGGPFVQDNSIAFWAATEASGYWRVDSKDVYTGKGWERSREAEPQSFQSGDPVGIDLYTENVATESRQAIVYPSQNQVLDRLVYPYGVQTFFSGQVGAAVDSDFGVVETFNRAQYPDENYTIAFEEPQYNIDDLRNDSELDDDNTHFRYTQLPEDLPERVGELAAEITSSANTRYDKAKAVEQYFNQNGFQYQTQDIPVPEDDQDYVDQFLFESKIGYCDNFSSSMVVLLRAADIPARWVKGFTAGQPGSNPNVSTPEGMSSYLVTNGNAHSWVEVYFPDTGWVPFEPTQGFTNPAEFTSEEDAAEETPEAETDTPEQEEQDQAPEQPEEEQPEEEPVADSQTDSTSVHPLYWILPSAVLLLAVIALYVTRYKWLTAYYIRKYRSEQSEETYGKAYHYLLRLLAYKGFKRHSGQTLREYAAAIDREFGNKRMSELTKEYERILYRNEKSAPAWINAVELWENLIKQAAS
ncbi:transglutaminaseTgpA domain-containing protein [Terribacillus saccharophilus]|uniref:transglutaminaseTgpA domain-containing protein n=1 Tax=Terribacillus saccharophilus TaxID=361277 RepID=UPI0039828C33